MSNNPLAPGSAQLYAFVEQVQKRGPLQFAEEAERVSRATLAALADAVSSSQAGALTPALPPELAEEMAAKTGQANAFDRGAFLDRISGHVRTVNQDELENQVRAVLATLADWQPRDQIDDTLQQLPAPLAELFGTNR